MNEAVQSRIARVIFVPAHHFEARWRYESPETPLMNLNAVCTLLSIIYHDDPLLDDPFSSDPPALAPPASMDSHPAQGYGEIPLCATSTHSTGATTQATELFGHAHTIQIKDCNFNDYGCCRENRSEECPSYGFIIVLISFSRSYASSTVHIGRCTPRFQGAVSSTHMPPYDPRKSL